mmetsp:Transcript_53459/g.135017  ORF Transcript_53459/g.135017 Transcript_53459/m.135017 type:complete len:99 (+) Transcript_53459:173-469(+)
MQGSTATLDASAWLMIERKATIMQKGAYAIHSKTVPKDTARQHRGDILFWIWSQCKSKKRPVCTHPALPMLAESGSGACHRHDREPYCSQHHNGQCAL